MAVSPSVSIPRKFRVSSSQYLSVDVDLRFREASVLPKLQCWKVVRQ